MRRRPTAFFNKNYLLRKHCSNCGACYSFHKYFALTHTPIRFFNSNQIRYNSRINMISLAPIDLDPFAFRQFDDINYAGCKLTKSSKAEFIQTVNDLYYGQSLSLLEGYAPFCKHLIIPNFTEAIPGTIKLTDEILPLIQSDYETRRPEELPVLTRWINLTSLEEKGMKLKPAKYLDLILYSKEQIKKESEAMMLKNNNILKSIKPKMMIDDPTLIPEYSIISIKAQDYPYELPMQPITMMRNTIITEGGSGVSINRLDYMASVNYWKMHCEIR